MNITCPHCKTRLNIPDHKLPRDRDSSFKCPKCKESVKVRSDSLRSDQTLPSGIKAANDSKAPSLGSSPDLGGNRRPALICMPESAVKSEVMAAVQRAGFESMSPDTTAEAFKKLEYHVFPLILIGEGFDGEKGIKRMARHMNELDMSLRRKSCLVLISSRFQTGDNMAALHASVNAIIGAQVAGQPGGIDPILAEVLAEHDALYTVFNASMKAAGKA